MNGMVTMLAQASETAPADGNAFGGFLLLCGAGWLLWAIFRPRGWTIERRSQTELRPH